MAGYFSFSEKIRKLLYGTPWGEVFPPKSNPSTLAVDGRTCCLRVLREYVTDLTFFREDAKGRPPIPFQIRPENFLIEWPDNPAQMAHPSVVVLPSRAVFDAFGLAGYVEEYSRDVYAPGTVLQWQSEYVEVINLEVHAASKAERRGILAGLDVAFSPTEQMSGVRFQVPAYYNELVCFSLNRREIMDDLDGARRRRRAQVELEMRFNVVALVNYAALVPTAKVVTDVDEDTGAVVEVDDLEDIGDELVACGEPARTQLPGTVP